MRKLSFLVSILILMSLALTGCSSGVISPIPDNPIPPDPDDVFDGSETHLIIEFERQAPKPKTFAEVPKEGLTSYIRISRTEGFHEVYSVLREVPVDPNKRTYSLEHVLPAEQGYKIGAILINENNEFLEFGIETSIDAPANAITTHQTQLIKPEYTLEMPEKMYSGGSLGQISIKTPSHYEGYAYVNLFLGLEPWDRNGLGEPNGWRIPGGSNGGGRLPEVTKPTKLYYQVRVEAANRMFPDDRSWPYAYHPDLAKGQELDFIWIYPYPGWEEDHPDWDK